MSTMMRILSVTLLTGALVAGVGCEAARQPGEGWDSGFQSKAVAGTTRERAYDATLAEMRSRFSVSSIDGAAMSMEADPQFLASGPGASTGRLHIISSPSDLRRLASARVRSEGGLVRTDVRVLIQRRDTAQHAAYHAMTSPGDVPRDTPIERGDELSPDQREVWVTQRRDFELEQEIIAGIEKRLGLTLRQSSEEP